LDKAQAWNFIKWPILSSASIIGNEAPVAGTGSGTGQVSVPPADRNLYSGHVYFLKTWLVNRVDWLSTANW
jgi:hypothetical protein